MKKTEIQKAFDFANEKHANQLRKSMRIPYMAHLYDVAKILAYNNADETTIIAGILHDTLEDTNATEAEILEHFGKEVLEIVKSETENKTLPYIERKQEMIDELANGSIQTKLVKCADMLSNISDLKQSIAFVGEKAWDCFNAPKETIGWYYKSMLNNMTGIENYRMFKELKQSINQVFLDAEQEKANIAVFN